MKFVAQDEPDLTLPEDSIHRARLEEVNYRTFDWTDKDGTPRTGETMEWWWEITSTSLGPQFVGRRVKAECKPVLSNRADNRFRMWSEALLNREIPVGVEIDTDDLVGLEADIVIGHRPDRKDPKNKRTWEYVSDVAPVSGARFDQELPF